MKKEKSVFGTKELIGIIIITTLISFFAGFFIKQADVKTDLSNYENEIISNYKYILENSYKNVNGRDLVSAAIKGMIDCLEDPYADYISVSDVDNFNLIINGEYQGIGVQIGYNDNNEPVITYVFPSSPADISGLKINDILISIEDIKVLDKNLDEIKDIVNGFDGEFKISYKRDENQYETILKRDIITVKSAVKTVYERENKKIGYIKLTNFASNSYEQFKESLESLESDKIESLIIDLRDNTGGQLKTVDNIVSLFINENNVIYQMKEKEKITKYYSHGNNNRSYPIVVLVNENSASASELMTGALKEVYGATIIGVNTYGKGTAQEVRTLENGEQYKFTTREWLTADGNSIEKVGIEPNIKIEQNEHYFVDPTEENDIQLQSAITFLCK